MNSIKKSNILVYRRWIILFFLVLLINQSQASFDNPTSTAYTKSIADIGEVFISENFINFTKNPANLAMIQEIRYGLDYQNDYFEAFFAKYNFYWTRRVKNFGLGLFFSDFLADEQDFDYSEIMFSPSLGIKINSFFNLGFNFKYFKINSSYLDASGFNSDIGTLILPVENLLLGLCWQNFLNSSLIWQNNRKENFKKELNFAVAYKIAESFVNLHIIMQYRLSDVTFNDFIISDKQDNNLKEGLVAYLFQNFYLSGSISQQEKSFGIGIDTKYFIIYFAHNIKDVGTQQSINVTFKGGNL